MPRAWARHHRHPPLPLPSSCRPWELQLRGPRRVPWALSWGSVFDSLVDHDWLVNDGFPDGLIGEGLIPTSHVGVFVAPGLVEDKLETARDQRCSVEVCKGDALTDKESVNQEVLLEDADNLVCGLLGIFNVLLVVGVAADEGTEPVTEIGKDFGVGVGHPPHDRGVVHLGLA